MIKRDDCKYMVLDGMPYVIAPDKRNWVFARSTKTWVLAGSDDWDVVYPNWETYWEDLFAELPELPEGAVPEQPMKEFNILEHELDNNLPHWLSPEEKNKNKLEPLRKTIMAKHRAKYLAKKKSEKPKQSMKTPYDDMPLDNLVDTTSEHLGEGIIIVGGWPSAKPKK
jgi:hypothetical protein